MSPKLRSSPLPLGYDTASYSAFAAAVLRVVAIVVAALMDDQSAALHIRELQSRRCGRLADALVRSLQQGQIAFVPCPFRSLVRLLPLGIEMWTGGLARRHLSVLHARPAIALLMHVKPPLAFGQARYGDFEGDTALPLGDHNRADLVADARIRDAIDVDGQLLGHGDASCEHESG